MKTILIVDDEPRTREGIRKTLEAWSAGRYQIKAASSGVEALQLFPEQRVNLVITDIRMPELGGLELIERLNDLPHSPLIIVISGHSEFDYAKRALQFGVVDYLLKPLDKGKLVQAVEIALEREEKQTRIKRLERMMDPRLLETMQEEKVYNVQIQEALAYVDEHLHQSMSMKEIADHLHLNASYFSVLFKEQTGLTFSEYLMRRRLQRAKGLLLGTTLSITEISERIGYQSAKYFIKVFRDQEHMSPSQYRQQAAEAGERNQ
ncbi:response regulator transcription factor [Paenibacillus sanguinis]|uniref:response regulator transcription factor n=1 Tax=Paenibacillus sanguinis TaxID=225906 RepID=UPI000363B285|nr:response regulator [Paenibacillus sanguinis]